ncbi:unnamed protein product, partial [Iphiclides podalirius]
MASASGAVVPFCSQPVAYRATEASGSLYTGPMIPVVLYKKECVRNAPAQSSGATAAGPAPDVFLFASNVVSLGWSW